jgi:O-antigen/teichoic acid export membrane protein
MFTPLVVPMNSEISTSPDGGPSRRGGIVRKGFWAVADQGLFAGSNCLVNVLLANWLSPADYGAFSTAFAGFLLLGVIHTALLTEPMLVFAPDRYRGRLGDYLGALVRGHVMISLGASGALLIAGFVCAIYDQASLATALYCFAASGPFTLFLWLMRRACYAQLNPRQAAFGGIGYLALILAGLWLVHHIGNLSIPWALALMGGSSMIVGTLLALRGRVKTLHLNAEILRDALVEHWRYGSWATATALLGFIPGNVYYFLLPKFASLEESGALRALTNLFNPFIQANAALCLLLLPAFVKTRGTSEHRRMHRDALLILAGAPLLYWLVIGVFHRQVIHLVYHDKYAAYSSLVWIIGLQPVIAGMCGVYGSLLRAAQKMTAVFWAGFVAAAASVTLGIGLMARFGMTGVCSSIVLTYGLHHITLWLFSRQMKKPLPQVRSSTAETTPTPAFA